MNVPDEKFFEREEVRALRLHLDYLQPELALQEHGIRHAVIVFGSTRATGRWYDEARAFGRLVGEHAGRERKNGSGDGVALMTGGGPGIMEAANRGALEAGGVSIGLNITLPREQQPNRYTSPGLSFHFRYFALRKLHFVLRARALVAFPGGYGTLDEVYETLMLVQTGKMDPLPIVLVGREFWKRALDAEFLAGEGVIDEADRSLFRTVDSANEAWKAVLEWYPQGLQGEPCAPGGTCERPAGGAVLA